MDVAKLKKKRRRKNGGNNTNANTNGADSLDGCEDDYEGGGDYYTDDDDEDNIYGGVPLDVQIPGVSTARTEDTSTDDGTASPSSQARSPIVTAGTDRGGAASESDGDASITSHGEIGGGDQDDDEEEEENEDGSGGASSLSASDPDNAKRGSSSDAPDEDGGSDIPSTPESRGSREEFVVTPIRLDATGPEEGNVALDEDVTPRAAGYQPTTLFCDDVPPASSAPTPTFATAATSPLRGLAPAAPGTRSSAIGDETAMLRTMVSLPVLRPAPKGTNFVIPEHETIEEEAKREIVSSGSGDAGEDNTNDDAARDLSLHIPIPLMKRESFASATSEYTYDDGSTITGDNVCPICLSGFKIGDLLVTSKYCSHVFHKVRLAFLNALQH
jgi:hypothetical protein